MFPALIFASFKCIKCSVALDHSPSLLVFFSKISCSVVLYLFDKHIFPLMPVRSEKMAGVAKKQN